MSNYLNRRNSIFKRLTLASAFAVISIASIVPYGEVKAFEIRNADTLSVMKSKPFAESANFRVSADMLIQPKLTIRSADLVVPAQPPTPVDPVTPPVVENGNNNGGGNGGQQFDNSTSYSSNWYLQRKYDELVRDRDEADEPFLASAPEDPRDRFDYFPPNPDTVELVNTESEEDLIIDNSADAEGDSSTVEDPILPEDVKDEDPGISKNETPYISENLTAEDILLGAAPKPQGQLVLDFGSQFNSPYKGEIDYSDLSTWAVSPSKYERLYGAAPSLIKDRSEIVNATQLDYVDCPTCEDRTCEISIWWWLLILLLLLINAIIQLIILHYMLTHFKKHHFKDFVKNMKKFLKSIGLMSVLLLSSTAVTQAQSTTTPQILIYEGELLDDLGAPAAGDYTFRFSFWDNGDYEATDVVGGTINAAAPDYLGWMEAQSTTTLDDGSFSLLLSEVTPFIAGMFDRDNLFLQVEVKNSVDPDTAYEFVDINLASDTDDRKVIASVPFAFNANKLDYRDLGFGSGNIPYLDFTGRLPDSVLPDLNVQDEDLDFTDVTLADFTNDLVLTNNRIFVGNASNIATEVTLSGDATISNTGVFTLANNSVGEDELDFGNVTLADFTNDVGFLTTVDISDNTNLTAGVGATLTGDQISINLGDTIEGSEITDGTITAADLNLTDITVSDFTNDAGYLSTVDVSDNTNLVAGTGIVLTDDTLSSTLGTTINSTEIENGTVKAEDLDLTDVTVSDFTNDAGYLTTEVDGSVTNEIQDLSRTGNTLSLSSDATTVDLSDYLDNTDTLADISCASGEIIKWNGTAWVCAPDAGGTAYTASDGITLTGSNFTNDFSTSIETGEITDGTITAADLNLTDITVSDFTNDAGYVTTDDDTLRDLSCANGEVAQWNGTAWVCAPSGAGGFFNVSHVLSPRYPSSIFEADGTNNTGSMFEEEETLASGIVGTILRWFSGQAVLQDYGIVVQFTVPEGFDSFQTPALNLDYLTEGTVADAKVDLTVERNNDGDDEISGAGIGLNSNTWSNGTFTFDGTTTWTAGDTIKIKIKMFSKDAQSAKVGNIKINYVSQ
ncbi:hypothetical protein GW756_02555 [bacterium]|nr:hypothetical protein [bacterium]NCQ55902.1 hypothetical protein [Candidatus Parcubacteria bacterium]NCS67610.1 hypothetical protein [Candidatus Peregrinibacteria bacterium]NCS96225.1 hypothetical protein [bacterium]